MAIPNIESRKSNSLLMGQAARYKITPYKCLNKVWHHKEAAKLVEYVAMTMLVQIISILDIKEKPAQEEV